MNYSRLLFSYSCYTYKVATVSSGLFRLIDEAYDGNVAEIIYACIHIMEHFLDLAKSMQKASLLCSPTGQEYLFLQLY